MKRFRINLSRRSETPDEAEGTPPGTVEPAEAAEGLIDEKAEKSERWRPARLFRRERRKVDGAPADATETVEAGSGAPEESLHEIQVTASLEERPRARFWRRALRRRAASEVEQTATEDTLAPAETHARRVRTRALPWRRRADQPAEPTDALEAEAQPRPHVRLHLRFPWRLRPGMLFLALAMFGAAGLGVALNLGRVPAAIGDLWPLALIGLGAVLLPGALRRRTGARLLAAVSLAAVGMSLLLAEAGLLPVQTTLATALLVALGFTVMVRAVLLHSAE